MDLPDAIDKARRFTVQITYTITGLPHQRLCELGARGKVWSEPLGTGFLVSDEGYVVTAAHVVDGIAALRQAVPEGKHIVGVGFAHVGASRGTFRVIRFDVLALDRRNDIALLRLRANPFTQSAEELRDERGNVLELGVAALRLDRPRDGDAIALSGYPLGEPALVTTSGNVASASSPDFQGALIPDGAGGYKPASIEERLLGDVQANPGNSGGPVYDLRDASVVGMLIAGRFQLPVVPPAQGIPADIAVIIPAATIADFVGAQNGPDLTLTDDRRPG